MIQYSIESFFILCFSSILGIVIMMLLPVPELEDVIYSSTYSIELIFQYLIFLFGLAIITGIIPFFVLSKINIIGSLKANVSNLKISGLSFQQTLLAFQLSCSLVTLIVLFVFVSQSNYAVDADYGFNAEKLWSIDLKGTKGELIENKIAAIANVEGTSLTSDYFGRMPGRMEARKPLDSINNFFFEYAIESHFIDMFNLRLLAGKNLSPVSLGNEIMVNEAALKALGYKWPAEAIGEPVIIRDSVSAHIVGVIKDFHFDNFKREILPLVLHNNLEDMQFLLFKVNDMNHLQEMMPQITQAWKEINPHIPLVLENYLQVFKTRQAHSDDLLLLSILCGYTVAISLLSLLGITMHHMKSRAKEISIHKIHGASNSNLSLLLLKDFLKIFFYTLLISLPVAYFACKSFLNMFAYRIDLGSLVFLLPCLALFSFAFSIVSLLALKTAAVNPVKNLRYE